MVVETVNNTIQESTNRVIDLLERENIIPRNLREPEVVSLFIPFFIFIAKYSFNCLFIVFQIPELFVSSDRQEAVISEANTLPHLEISTVECQWLQVLSEGWAYPLRGFMREHEYLQVLHFNCIRNEHEPSIRENQSVPIVLSCTEADKERFADASAISLFYNGKVVAILRKPEIYFQRKEERCSRQFGTNERKHPYIKMIYESGAYLIGGDLEVIERIRWDDGLDEYRLTPNELRAKFREQNADGILNLNTTINQSNIN